MTRSTLRHGSFLVYFNGIEVPVSSVSVRFGIWEPPSCDITMPADPLLRRLGHGDRIRATVFFLDESRSTPEYCLLFDGEIHATSTQSSKGSKTRTFHCVDLLAALNVIRTYFLMDIPGLVQRALGDVNTEAPIGAHFRPIFPVSLFYYGLDPSQNQVIRRPFDLLENMLRALISVTDIPAELREAVTGDPNDHKGVVALQWFSSWCRRTGFHRRFVPMPGFEDVYASDHVDAEGNPTVFPILRAMQSSSVIDALTAVGQRVGDQGTLWQLLLQVFQQMLYEVQAIPAPAYVGVRRGSYEVTGDPGTGDESRILAYVTKPNLLFGLAPACNVVWSSQRMAASTSESYSTQPTRVLFSEGSLFGLTGQEHAEGGLQELYNLSMSVAFPPQAQAALDARLGRGGRARDTTRNPHNFLVWPEEFFLGPVPLHGRIPTWFRYLNAAEAVDTGQTGNSSDPQLVLAGLRRTMADFLAPLVARLPGDTQLQARVTATGLTAQGAQNALAALQRPITDRPLGEVQQETQALLGVLRALGFSGPVPPLVEGIGAGTSQNPTFQTYAAYEFWRERASKRNGSATLLFHPFLTPGFPGVFWDTETDGDHQMGYVTNVQHTLTEGSMSTAVSWTYGMSFNEFFEELRATRAAESGRPSFESDRSAASVRLGEAEPVKLPTEQVGGFAAEQVADYMRRVFEAGSLGAEAALEGPMDAAPPSPIQAIRRGFQRLNGAREAYRRLFWRGQPRRPFIESVLDEVHDLEEVCELLDTESGISRPLNVSEERSFADPNLVFRPTAYFQALQDDPEAAADYGWRPATTLDEFIQAHADLRPPDLEQHRVTPGDPFEGKGAPYYRKILQLRAGPGPEPEETPRGGRVGDNDADTRYNWERVLVTYRNRVYRRRADRG